MDQNMGKGTNQRIKQKTGLITTDQMDQSDETDQLTSHQLTKAAAIQTPLLLIFRNIFERRRRKVSPRFHFSFKRQTVREWNEGLTD